MFENEGMCLVEWGCDNNQGLFSLINVYFQLPLVTSVFRRSSPEEDYLWSLGGIQNLVDQQNVILHKFKKQLESQEEYAESEEGLGILPRLEAGCDWSKETHLLQERRREMMSLKMFRVRLEQRLNKNTFKLFD